MSERNLLGAFLRNRRSRLDPATFGFAAGRRRTPGLRREEVAQRANISPTWYTWLEQGRGGAPSADVLDRIATGLMLTAPEREHLFVLGLGRLPEARYRIRDGISPRLQRVLDALLFSPALIRTPTWDIVGWNRAAAALLTDYAAIPPKERNVLRLMFGSSRVREAQGDWQSVARFVVGSLRADAIRAGADTEVAELAEELSRISPEFAALWQDNEVISVADGNKSLHHPELGAIDLEFSTFAVDGRPDLAMVVYNPATEESARRIAAYLEQSG
ncbi:MAG: helix-turn-helix transcriptional regulator [Candidatus Andeanibacterium colombiense]|uniref:Helix-turn-helix transcriptional regulator n=1 Tax=Candidatus Andeanibacterium colombiense TaxID=3121345 RepID=A0AAJ6BNK7_9SPHN|nr:MAG: helix-turn-helix transcriptional regulator [Sphingomonadaceae bacterium]